MSLCLQTPAEEKAIKQAPSLCTSAVLTNVSTHKFAVYIYILCRSCKAWKKWHWVLCLLPHEHLLKHTRSTEAKCQCSTYLSLSLYLGSFYPLDLWKMMMMLLCCLRVFCSLISKRADQWKGKSAVLRVRKPNLQASIANSHKNNVCFFQASWVYNYIL